MQAALTRGSSSSCRSIRGSSNRRHGGGPLVARQQQQQLVKVRRRVRLAAAGGGEPSSSSAPQLADGGGARVSSIGESDVAFVAKLALASTVGAAVIKYGSLLISLPFEPSPAVAVGVVLGTPAVYSLVLLARSAKQQ